MWDEVRLGTNHHFNRINRGDNMRPIRCALASAFLLSGCGGGGTTTVPTSAPVATVTLSSTAASLAPGATQQFTATTKDASGNVLTGRGVTWSSTSSTVASVSNGGLVTALAAGTTIISATSEGQSGNATITVTPVVAPVASVTLSQSSATLVPTSTQLLTATPKDAAGNSLSGRTIIWTTSSALIATVSTGGLVTGAALGTATITATSEGKSADATITVNAGAVIGAAGGTVSSVDGNASVVIPAGALSQATPISIVPAVGTPANAFMLAGTAYDFLPSGTQFAQPATITLKYGATAIPAGYPRAITRIDLDSAGAWVPVLGSTVDTVARIVTAAVTHFSGRSASNGPVYIAGNTNAAGDIATQLNAPHLQVTLCVNEQTTVGVMAVPGQTLTGTQTVTDSRPGIVSASGLNTAGSNISLYGIRSGTTSLLIIYGTFPFQAFGVVNVTVKDCTEGVSATASVTTGPTSANNNVIVISHGSTHTVTSSNESRHPVHGRSRSDPPNLRATGSANLAAADTPLAYQDLSGPSPREIIYWNGINGTATPVALPSSTPPYGAGTFTDAGAYLFIGPVGQTADVWAVASGGSTAVQLTNLHGAANNVAIGPDGMMYIDWHPAGVAAHIWRLAMPTIGSTPPTSGQVQITSSSLAETQPAISQHGGLLAYSQNDPTFTKAQVFVLSLTATGATPVLVSPATGFAFSPAWCGNEFLYYSYSATIGGSYQLMKWDPVLGTTTPVVAFAGFNVYDFAVARTDGDGGVHVCPQ